MSFIGKLQTKIKGGIKKAKKAYSNYQKAEEERAGKRRADEETRIAKERERIKAERKLVEARQQLKRDREALAKAKQKAGGNTADKVTKFLKTTQKSFDQLMGPPKRRRRVVRRTVVSRKRKSTRR